MITNPNTLRIAVRFNPANQQWIARHTKLVEFKANGRITRDHQYGYGTSLMEAVDNVIALAGQMATRMMCKVVTPSRHIHTVQVN